VRLVRLGPETAKIGADVRAALSSWGPADTVLGGIALLGLTPAGCDAPVEAIIVLPRGVVVVVGVDLPDPAMRLDAPLGEQWKIDGWPLVRPDGAVNPASEALAAAAAVTKRLQFSRIEPVPVCTVVAVGPYVGQVVQPSSDLNRGVRVLHPVPTTLRTAVRELATYEQACTVEQTRRLIRALVGGSFEPSIGELAAEGFTDSVSPHLAAASTTIIPKITDRPEPPPPRRSRGNRTDSSSSSGVRWLPIGALALLGVLVVAGIVVATTTSGHAGPTAAPAAKTAVPTTTTAPAQADDVTVAGLSYRPEGSTEGQDCAQRSTGAVQTWLAQHPCSTLARSAYQTVDNGRAVAVAVAAVGFADPQTATAFAAVANTPGSGGVNDLVADGKGWPGGPTSFAGAAVTVVVQGNTVRLTEVVWVAPPSTPTDPTLLTLAQQAEALPAIP
jgi:hypothetical protein